MLSKIADMLHLGNPVGIIIVYLGFGAGLAVFMFCGFVKSIPLEIEEAAMIVIAIIPIIFFYITCQKYIIEGVAAGAVKG